MESKNLKKFIYEWFIPVILIDLMMHVVAYFTNRKFSFEDKEILFLLNSFFILFVFRLIFYTYKALIQMFLKETFKGKILLLFILVTLILMKLK